MHIMTENGFRLIGGFDFRLSASRKAIQKEIDLARLEVSKAQLAFHNASDDSERRKEHTSLMAAYDSLAKAQNKRLGASF